MKYTIREIQKEEYSLLKDFLYEAIFTPEGMTPPPKTILSSPELQVYIKDFGEKSGDQGMVAEIDHKIVGAAWARIMQDYGHIDDNTPSLAMSLYKEYRGHGIGSALLSGLLAKLRCSQYDAVSLSVQKTNYAVKMYQKAGFKIVRETEDGYIMIADIS